MKKQRKSLGDSLAEQFVYGEPAQPAAAEPASEPEPAAPPAPAPKESSLISQLQANQKEATVRFTVDMPKSMHQKLSLLALRTGKKKVEIVRLVLEEALKDVED